MRIYIDCTDSIKTDINTGIQRVARNIINNRFSAQEKLGFLLQPVYYDKTYGFIKVSGCAKNDFNNSIGYLHSVGSCLFEFWRFKRLIKALFPFPQFQNWLTSHWKGSSRWFLLWPLLIAIVIMIPVITSALFYAIMIPPRNVWSPCQKDILILPGSSWWDDNSKLGIQNVKANAGQIAIILYDLIPLSHPHFFTDTIVKNFTSNFLYIVSNADLFIAISKTTEDVLKKYLLDSPALNTPATSHFLLGADLDLIKQKHQPSELLEATFTRNKPYLCVGTLDPRKNHAFLLDAFDKIWQSNHEVHLCIVGCYGWKSEDTTKRILDHPLYGKNLTWFSDLDDSGLSYCYKNAKALIFPSVIEGFGLPLIEALYYGCPVMASDIPVFREIGEKRCSYFSIDTPDSLVAAINGFEASGKLPCVQQTDEFKWINWEESALAFYTRIVEHFRNGDIARK